MTGTSSEARIGIDFGGVVIPISKDDSVKDEIFYENRGLTFRNTPPFPNALDTIARLYDRYHGNVWIVSKATQPTRERVLAWMKFNDFFSITGLKRDHIFFCDKRPQKRDHCIELGITHFIDDRVHVLDIIKDVVDNLYLFGPQKMTSHVLRWATLVKDWDEVAELLLG